ncbi:hypothetical protein GCK32_005503 [Trichostrongylus colubriformis]|uniref:Uncharacterized protein n=1 Tax=Trichostrongylus colubriformis TaxID=6319 RepID=A0AAN8IAH4_TRICO
MDKLQGGDWNSFFHQFEAVASQSTANVSRPSIVDDNVPLPIIRGHHFDIVYHDAMDEHVKCQVCGMLLRRTMFAAHVRQRHPELCPPSISTDDDSGRHSGLESPDISRNPNFPFSPKLMSPPITKEPLKLTISLKGHRKHRRRKAKRDRRRDSRPSTSFGEEKDLSSDPLQHAGDHFWPVDDEQGPSTRHISPTFLEEAATPLSRLKGSESSGSGEEFSSRVDPEILSSEEQSRRKVKKKSRRKSRRRELGAQLSSPILRARILPLVEPLHISVTSESTQVSKSASPVHKSSGVSPCCIASVSTRSRPGTGRYLHARRSAFADVVPSFSVPSKSPSTSHLLTRFPSQPANVGITSSEELEPAKLTVLVGQPSQRAHPTAHPILPRVSQIPSVVSPSPWIYSQPVISTSSMPSPSRNTPLAQGTADESDTFRSEALSFDPVTKTAHMESGVLSHTTTAHMESSVLSHATAGGPGQDEQQLLSVPSTEASKTVNLKKSRQPSGPQELWEPLGIKSPTYGIILPVATKNDTDADDATVAFLTSSPELLSEDDGCPVKEEVDEQQIGLLVKGTSPSRILRQRYRSATKLTSESTDTDHRTIIDFEENQAERRSSDHDGEIQMLSNEMAALSQLSELERLDFGMNCEHERMEDTIMMEKGNDESDPKDVRTPASHQVKQTFDSSRCHTPEDSIFSVDANPVPTLIGSRKLSTALESPLKNNQAQLEGGLLAHSLQDVLGLEDMSSKELVNVCALQRPLESGATATMSIEGHGGEPIQVIISSRTDKIYEPEAPCEAHHAQMASANAGKLRECEEENLYDEDYSADDEELVHFQEESERNHQEILQQSEYERSLMQQQSSFVASAAAFHNQMLLEQTTPSYRPSHEHVFSGRSSQNSAVNYAESPQLSIQTVFENNHRGTVHDSGPSLQTVVARVASGPVSSPFGIGSTSLPVQPHQCAPPPHTFPLQTQRISNAQPRKPIAPRDSYIEGSNVIGIAAAEVEAQKGSHAPIHVTSLQEQFRGLPEQHQIIDQSLSHSLETQWCSLSEKREASRGYNHPRQAAQPLEQRNIYHHEEASKRHSYNATKMRDEPERYANLQRHPAELMEEEMRAMRYVYLMNEQRIAKKSLAEADKKIVRKSTPANNLMFLSELPPTMVEPTVIPEGIPRTRMQEHLLPPYHHAQFAVRNGPCVSPFNSDTSEDELTNVQEVLNLEILEPLGNRANVQRIPTQYGQRAAHAKEGHNASYKVPPSTTHDVVRQQHLSGSSAQSEFIHQSDQSHPRSPAVQMVDDAHLNASEALFSSKISRNQSTLQKSIPQQMDVPLSSMRETLSSNEEEPDASDVEMWNVREREIGTESSDDASTDSEVIRRGWDLSPSVSPLTLEAFASVLSSPEGSDSNDDQVGVPVWSTMSRKHAKLAIAVCRNMPKRLQPLCRRFAWQQGITYLLENFCLQKWEIRPEHDVESVWFFEKLVRRFKPFEVMPWEVSDSDKDSETPKRVANVFFGFNICADIPFSRCRKTIRIEDHASLTLTCKEIQRDIEVSSSDDGTFSKMFTKPESETSPVSPLTSSVDSASTEDESECSSDDSTGRSKANGADSCWKILPLKLSCEKQEFIAMSCCKQFMQQMVERKNGNHLRVGDRSAVQVTSILAELYREHRAAYELMIADILPIPTPDQREIPFSDNAEWVASRILAINRAQNRLLISSFAPWVAMHRLWKVYGPLLQSASAIGGDFEKFVTECVNVTCNHYYRLKNGIKVADEIPGDLLDLCYAITSERMREHTESVEVSKKRVQMETKPSKAWVPLKRREGPCSYPNQRTANAQLMSRCRRVYDEKRQTKRRRWNAMRYLHNALPGSVIEGIDVFDMAQRTNLSVAGIFGPEHKMSLAELPFASNMDNRPAYLDMEELLGLMDRTLALQSGSTHGLHFKAITGERGRCHLMVSPSPIPVPPVAVDCYGNVSAIQRAAIPKLLYPEFARRKLLNVAEERYSHPLDSPVSEEKDADVLTTDCPMCLRTSSDYADMDFVRMCFEGLPQEVLEDLEVSDVDTSCTSYRSHTAPHIMDENDLNKLMMSG